jgi:hypothetical protein
LAECYETGRGIEQDLSKAIELYRQAAEKGVNDAMVALATMLYEGRGATMDSCEAQRWLEKAAANGSEPAKEKLAKMVLKGAA